MEMQGTVQMMGKKINKSKQHAKLHHTDQHSEIGRTSPKRPPVRLHAEAQNPFLPGTPKPVGSTYTKTLVIPRTEDEDVS
jgi:hypothetical protein